MGRFITIGLLLLIFSGCRQRDDKKAANLSPYVNSSPVFYSDKLHRTDSAEKRRTEKGEEESNRQDSIDLKSMLRMALSIADKRLSENKFKCRFDFWPNRYHTYLTFSYGSSFSKNRRHLIVKRCVDGLTYLDVFIFKAGRFKSVLSCFIEDDAYLAYQIKDVNGDGKKDFLVHYYPSSGCCRRDVFDVYLNNSSEGQFSKSYKFINPTFSPSEKIIRGVEYGQPGAVPLYKYKWNGWRVDTIEIILPDPASKKYHVFKCQADFDDPEKGKYITAIPKEYRKIKDYDWFRGIY